MTDPSLDTVQMHDLVARTRQGDRAAEDRLVRAILGRFENLARRMLQRFPAVRGAEETADVVQGALVRLLRAVRAVTPATTRDFFNLAAEQIRRQLLDLSRRHRRGRPAQLPSPDDSNADVPDSAPGAADLDRWEQFHAAVDGLPAEQREVVGLTFYHGWTQAQIAELFQVDERTVRRRWHAACATLNQSLGGRLPDL